MVTGTVFFHGLLSNLLNYTKNKLDSIYSFGFKLRLIFFTSRSNVEYFVGKPVCTFQQLVESLLATPLFKCHFMLLGIFFIDKSIIPSNGIVMKRIFISRPHRNILQNLKHILNPLKRKKWKHFHPIYMAFKAAHIQYDVELYFYTNNNNKHNNRRIF